MAFRIRDGLADDVDQLAVLFPRLADFDLPPGRNPDDLWQGDVALLRKWARGEAPECLVKVAVDDDDRIIGGALVSLCDEHLSHQPSAHLEALAVSATADGHGIGRKLLTEIEVASQARGARSMTLHVFMRNRRARHVYAELGYDEELLRCFKPLAQE